jgi:hypothetical protein
MYAVCIVPSLLSTMGTVHIKITRHFDTAESALWSIYSDAESNTEHMPLSYKVSSRIMSKQCLFSDTYSLRTS